jgi:hypothetical protein
MQIGFISMFFLYKDNFLLLDKKPKNGKNISILEDDITIEK